MLGSLRCSSVSSCNIRSSSSSFPYRHLPQPTKVQNKTKTIFYRLFCVMIAMMMRKKLLRLIIVRLLFKYLQGNSFTSVVRTYAIHTFTRRFAKASSRDSIFRTVPADSHILSVMHAPSLNL